MNYENFFNLPNNAHDRGGILAYGDGHVERHKWQDARTIAAVSDDYHRHSDGSQGNLDIYWLRARTTVPRLSAGARWSAVRFSA